MIDRVDDKTANRRRSERGVLCGLHDFAECRRHSASFSRKEKQAINKSDPSSIASPTSSSFGTSAEFKCSQGDSHSTFKLTLIDFPNVAFFFVLFFVLFHS